MVWFELTNFSKNFLAITSLNSGCEQQRCIYLQDIPV